MTSPIATEVNGRRFPNRNARATPFAAIAAVALRVSTEREGVSWPSARYHDDPVAFFREVLGVEPWDRQIEVIEAIRDNPRVAVASGHKVSKSHTAAGIALWFYSSFEDARVVLTSTTSRQVDQILWRELKMLHARSGRCALCKLEDRARAARHEPPGPRPCKHSACLDGEPRELARTGLKSPDFREIVGFTAKEAEAVAGVSGKNLLYIPDEASGIDDAVFEAIEGNRAGGARIVMFSNPTRTEGEFYEAFHSKAAFYKTIRISSEETPNVKAGRVVVPGLATREWVDEKRLEWGEDSALYKIRVKGEFVLNETGRIFSVHAITESEARWADAIGEGRLCIGVDPAGPGEGGDESAFAVRRGNKIIALVGVTGLSDEAHLVHVLGLIKQYGNQRESLPPLIACDREGVGYDVWKVLRSHADGREPKFEVIGVRSSDRAAREPEIYDRVRDELWANLAAWVREGGALIPDTKLEKELHCPEWDTASLRGRMKVTPKTAMRKTLGRSPDRADAVALAVWGLAADAKGAPSPEPPRPDQAPAPRLDPYAGGGAWR